MTDPVVRVAGLPTTTLAELRFPRTAAVADELAAGKEWLAREGGALADALHEVIGARAGHPAKPGLVGLRRAFHQGRAPRPPEWGPQIAALLPAPLATRVEAWLTRRAEWHHRRAELDRVLTAEQADRIAALRELAADPGFRRGLWHASPSLSDELDRWLGDPDRSLRRPVQRRLATYLARACAKSAVFSSFATTGFGQWVDGHAGNPAVRPAPDLRTVTSFHNTLRERLVAALVQDPALWRVLAVRVNPSLTTGPDGADHWFVGPPPGEPIRVLRPHPVLQRCVELAGDAGSATWTTMGALQDQLGEATGTPPERLRGYLTRLVGAGLLEVGPPPDRLPVVSFAGLAGWAATGDDPELAARLRRLEESLRATERRPELAAHRRGHQAVSAATSQLADRLGFPVDEPRAATDDLVAAGPLADCPTAGWRPALADLAAVRGWLGLFDRHLPLRRALQRWWDEHHPDQQAMPLLVFHQRFGPVAGALDELFAGPAFPADLLASPVPGVAEVGELRSAALAQLADVSPDPDPDGQVRVPIEALAGAAATWPTWVPAIEELTCYLQHDGSRVVVNRLDTGYGKVTCRTGYLLRRAGVAAAVPPREAGPVVLAELGGLHGHALNAREPCLPYEIDYPFAPSARPAGQRIPLADLMVARDRDRRLRLRSTRLGAEVRVVYPGALLPALLPPLARLLVAGFGCPAPPFTVPMADPGPLSGFQWLPRVSFGSVVVRRARWAFQPAQVPTRSAGETDAGYLLRLTGWRRAYGVPDRCFVRALPRGDQTLPPTEDAARMRAFLTLRKPFYVDFTSWYLVQAFVHLLRTPREFVVCEEALPDPTAVDRVVELLVEVPDRAAGDPR